MSGVWLVLPTYNEAENLERIVRASLPHLAETGLAHRILVVDDNSPDGTGDIAARLAQDIEVVEVLHRPRKAGLGPAYLAGFERALEGGADLMMEMDSDFSHDPADISRLVEAVSDTDLVLGSRYVRGGGVQDWGVGRRIVSRGGSLYAKAVLGVPVQDLTGGFKVFRRAVLEGLDLSGLDTNGYGFQIEMTYRALNAGFRVKEVPIIFRARTAGKSKMVPSIAIEALWKVPLLRWRVR